MSRIRAAVDRGDHWNLSRESHAFKGSVSTFFARAAFAAARRMKEDHDLSNAPANIVLFEREVIRLKEELEDILKTRALVARSLENIPPQQLPNLTETFEQSKPNSSTGQNLQYPDGDQPGYIGRYAITETIGKSGYGTVYKAFDERLDREVAVKVPRLAMKSTDSQTDLETAFLHEARKVARLRHPNIVTVHDIGVAEDRCYIVAEYLHGPNLTNWLLNRNPSWKEAARLAAEIADGLASAHASGIVHRDVKPANIILTGPEAKPVPVLVDFGLATYSDGSHRESQTGIRGTPHYMSPEQARGENESIDGRADIYALGVILYRLLTGRLPFVATEIKDLLQKVLHDYPVPPRQFVHHVPRKLERLCLAALAKEAKDRPSSAVDFAEDLRAIIREHEPRSLNTLADSTGSGDSSVRVLVAEDDEAIRTKLASDISKWGHHVTSARDGEEAWSLFLKGDFQIVITDWEMPRLNGLQLVERIRAAPRADYVYIMMLTSRSSREDIVNGLGAGADDFLAKPAHRDELNVRLRAGRRIAEMTRALSDSNRRMRAVFDAAARTIRSRLPDRDYSRDRVRLAWDYRPCAELGGNLIHLSRSGSHHLSFHLIDAEGHGIPAALAAASIDDEIGRLQQSREAIDSPVEILNHLCRRVTKPGIDPSISVMARRIDLAKNSLIFANAGFEAPILVKSGHPIQRVGTTEPPIGLAPVDHEYSARTVALDSLDRLVIASTGIVSSVNSRNTPFGSGRFMTAVESAKSETAAGILDAIVKCAEAWRGNTSQSDDVTVLVIESC